METTQLQQGISILYDMEKNNYLMSCAIQGLNERIEALGHPRSITQPIQKHAKPVKKLTFVEKIKKFFSDDNIWGIGGISGGIVGAVFGFMFFFDALNNFFAALFGALGILIGCAAVGIIITFGGFLIYQWQFFKKEQERFQSLHKKYDQNYLQEHQTYMLKIEQDRERVQKELCLKEALCAERDALIKRNEDATKRLHDWYDCMGINAQFRNIIAIGYMEEYITLGIANKLEGIDGLYYLTKKELKDKMLWEKLLEFGQTLFDKMDQIIGLEQEQLYALDQLNNTCNNILKSTEKMIDQSIATNRALNEIKLNTELSEYHLERIAKEEAYQSIFLTYQSI